MTEQEIQSKFDTLSEDAKRVGAAWFGMMKPETTSSLTFHMISSKPSDRAQKGLDELVESKFIKKTKSGTKVIYLPLVDGHMFFVWYAKKYGVFDGPKDDFLLTQKIETKND